MTYEAQINQGRVAFEGLKSIDIDALCATPGLPAWNGADIGQFHGAFEALIETLEAIFENDVLLELPFNLVSSFSTHLNKLLQVLSQFSASPNHQHFHAAFQQVEGMRTNLQTWGLATLSILGHEVQNRISQINDELAAIIGRKGEIDQLKASVEALIEPAVAGSLSKAFSDRKGELEKKESKWYVASVFMALLAMIATACIVLSIAPGFEDALAASQDAEKTKTEISWSALLLRLGILLPIYSVFGLTFSQYSKERNLEEEYAHRSAVATSLPNYGDLAADSTVKDQIVSEAAKVIFTSPTAKARKDDNPTAMPGIDQLNSLLKNLQKLGKSGGGES